MASRHHDTVTIAARKGAKKASGGKRKLKHMVIRPVANGFMSEKHYEPEEGENSFDMDETAHVDTGDASAKENLMDHVDETFPDQESGEQGSTDGASQKEQ